MEREKILRTAKLIIGDEIKIIEEDALKLSEETELVDILNSLCLINIIVDLEHTYNINIPDCDIEKVTTIKSLVNYLTSRL